MAEMGAPAKKNIMTYAGLKKLEQGDLSENAEYDAAKDEQRDIEARIEQIEKILKNAEVVAEDEMSTTDINVGCTVRLYDVEFEEELEFAIVGSTEANSLNGMISNESPVGSALLGKRVGDVVAVELANGEISHYEIREISRTKITETERGGAARCLPA